MITSLSADSAPADPDDELLVAYLDGELDRNQRTALENRLLGEPPLRGRLTELQSSWDMLDVLSVDGAGVSLVETTMELAIAEVQSEARFGTKAGVSTTQPEKSARNLVSKPHPRSVWKSKSTLKIVFGCLLAMLIGWAAARIQSNRAYQSELIDLAIAENLDAYNLGADLELMRMLAGNPDWLDLTAKMSELSPAPQTDQSLATVPLAQRTEAIQAMSIDQRRRLGLRWESFERLSDENKTKVRDQAAAVAKDPNSDALLETMKSYATWRSKLSSDLLDQIEGDDRVACRQAIQTAIEQSKSSLAKQAGLQLDEEAVDVIYFALQEFARKRMGRDIRRFKPPGGFRGPLADPKTREWFAIRQFFGYSDQRTKQRTESDADGRNGNEQDGNSRAGTRRRGALSTAELNTIESLLPESSRETLNVLTSGDPTLASMTLQIWVEEVIRRKTPFRNGDSMLERYQNLTEDQQEWIDLLPPEKILESLSGTR